MKTIEQKKQGKNGNREGQGRNGSNHSFHLTPAHQTQKKSIASCDEVNHTNDSWSRQMISNKDCVSARVCAHVMGKSCIVGRDD